MTLSSHDHTAACETSAVQQGSEKAHRVRPYVEQLIARQRGRYLGYLRRRLALPEDAEDAFQDFCVRALGKAEQVREAATVEAWLQRVLFSVLQDAYRAKGANRRVHDQLRHSAQIAAQMNHKPQEDEEKPTLCACIYAHLPALKPDYGKILWQIDFMDRPRHEVAQDLGMSAGTMRVRLHRARKALRSRLRRDCPTCAEGTAETCHFATNCNARGALAS